MQIIQLNLQSFGTLCELIPDDLAQGEALINELLFSVLFDLPRFATVDSVKLEFSRFQNLYTLKICIWCFDSLIALPDDLDHLQATIEGRVEPVLLQLLGEVFSLENPM